MHLAHRSEAISMLGITDWVVPKWPWEECWGSLTNTHLPAPLPTAKKLPKNEPQNAAGAPGRNRGVDLQENNPASRSQCCSN